MDFILENIPLESFILVNGRSYTGKTTLAQELKERLKQTYHVSITNPKTIKSLASISVFSDYNIVRLRVEEKTIELHLRENRILPDPESQKYRDIFKPDRYITNQNSLAYKNNLVIIDDCHWVKIEYLESFFKAVLKVLPESKFVLLGNSRGHVNYHNIFSISVFKNNLNSKFKKTELTHKSKFINTFPTLLIYEKLYMTDRREGVGTFLKYFMRDRDVDINETSKRSELHVSCDYELIDKFNNKFLPETSKQFTFDPIVDLSDYSKDFVELFERYYFYHLKSRVLFLGARVVHEGEYGYVTGINDKTVKIVVNKRERVVNYVLMKNAETNIKISYMPLDLAYCIHYKDLEPRDSVVMIVSTGMPLDFFETCLNKAKGLYFKNTGLINCHNLFSLSYIQDQANKI